MLRPPRYPRTAAGHPGPATLWDHSECSQWNGMQQESWGGSNNPLETVVGVRDPQSCAGAASVLEMAFSLLGDAANETQRKAAPLLCSSPERPRDLCRNRAFGANHGEEAIFSPSAARVPALAQEVAGETTAPLAPAQGSSGHSSFPKICWLCHGWGWRPRMGGERTASGRASGWGWAKRGAVGPGSLGTSGSSSLLGGPAFPTGNRRWWSTEAGCWNVSCLCETRVVAPTLLKHPPARRRGCHLSRAHFPNSKTFPAATWLLKAEGKEEKKAAGAERAETRQGSSAAGSPPHRPAPIVRPGGRARSGPVPGPRSPVPAHSPAPSAVTMASGEMQTPRS